jgi:DNA-binding beta-propeller fold protein YncE
MRFSLGVALALAPLLYGQALPTGMSVTPLAAPGAQFFPLSANPTAAKPAYSGWPVTMASSPDGNTLLVLTSGYNSTEYVFVYDIASKTPVFRQALSAAGTFMGLAWNPNGKEFYVSGGYKDVVYTYALQTTGRFASSGSIPLSHPVLGVGTGLGIGVGSVAAGVAVSPAGDRLAVTNYLNDSLSIIDLVARKKIAEVDLRPGDGVAGGEYPFWPVFKGSDRVYVSSLRDREVVVVGLGDTPSVVARIPVKGQPNKMVLNAAGNLLYAAVDNSDSVAIIGTDDNVVLETVFTGATTSPYNRWFTGANPNSLALSPDESTLYVTNGGTNTIAVISLNPGYLRGLIPTGWYPDAVTVSTDGSTLYVANAKSIPGPNPAKQYVLNLERGGLLTLPVPDADTLSTLSTQAATNNHFAFSDDHATNASVMAQLRDKIHHVIYVIKENRTYDQVLGDLPGGNGDPSLALFPEAITPNLHQLARQFVNLDNFYDSGEVSGVGWNWSTAGRATDVVEKDVPVSYANHMGPSFYDYEGTNRNVNVGIADIAGRSAANPLMPQDPNLLPGTADVAAPDSSEGEAGAGYLWDAALRQGLTVRNYGCYLDLILYTTVGVPAPQSPFAAGVVQATPAKASLIGRTDPYFRGFDNNYPDLFRYQEWAREFDLFAANGDLPQLSMVRLMHDHTGNFATAQLGVNTPETQLADNDYAVGLMVEKVAQSPYKDDTLIFVIEDDAQDGPDHVDAHRSIAFVAGPYVRQGALVTDRFTTVSMMRTIKDVLGIPWMGLYDGTSEPMASVFDLGQKDWTFVSKVPEVLRTTQLPLPERTAENTLPRTRANQAYAKPRRNAKYWTKAMSAQNFDKEDDLNEVDYNRELWIGLKGKGVPYPAVRDGRDLRQPAR